MDTKRPLAPSFLNRLDRYLLLNKPEIWSARMHMVLYYGILFMALLTAISFVVPDDPRTESTAGYWSMLVWLISFVSFIGWLIFLLRFNVFKRYGLTNAVNRLVIFILYFISIGIFVLFGYVKPYVETVRANSAYSDQELVNDVNSFNMGIAQLAYDSMDHRWTRDSVLVVDSIPENEPDYDALPIVADSAPSIRKVPFNNIKSFLDNSDSVRKVNDTTYIVFYCPDYVFLFPYGFRDHDEKQVMGEMDIYKKVIVNYNRSADTMPVFNAVNAIRKKYQWQDGYEYYYEQTETYRRIEQRYGVRDVSSSISNILERKHRWSGENLEIFIRIIYYSTLVLSLLVFTFRHSTAKTFFLTILTGIILIVLTSLIVAFTGYGDESVLTHIITYFIVALLLSFTAFTSKIRNVFTGISINICLWLLPFIPLCLVARHYARLQRRQWEDYERFYELKEQHLQLAEIVGIVFLLIFIATYFHRAYRKWYAAPES